MTDALAAIVDANGHPPRQGDGDDGVGLLLDHPAYDRWKGLLATGTRIFGPLPWWPKLAEEDVRTALWTRAIKRPELSASRPSVRPNLFEDAGHVYLRAGSSNEEIWCRCDHGPHGFLSIAAHAHADALSIEIRVGGVQVLADPGTYCYHGDPQWRAYFRSTRGHNTLELLGRDQSISGGPFLWTQQAETRLLAADGLDEQSPKARWQAEHTGYLAQGGPVHCRTVILNRKRRILTIRDQLSRGTTEALPTRLAFHFGPEVDCQLAAGTALLSWPGGNATLELSEALSWTLHRGEVHPPFGWFSPSFDRKIPSFSLLGTGESCESLPLISRLCFSGSEHDGRRR
jgi:hypothetical protein